MTQLSLLDSECEVSVAVPANPVSAPVIPVCGETDGERGYQGFVNSATFCMSLYLSNDKEHSDSIYELIRPDGTLNPESIKVYVESLSGNRTIVLDEWAEGEVDWAEIARDWLADGAPALETGPLQVLAELTVEDGVVYLPRQLDRKLYQKVDEILQGLGGKWNRSRKGHVFDEDPSAQIETIVLTGRYTKPENFDYFPTPPALARFLVSKADVRQGMRVLEPQAGQGGIADEITKVLGKDAVTTIELQERNAKVLREKGYQPLVMDFLDYRSNERFDRVVMNPPFSPCQADIAHVLKAWEFVATGGRLVSVMASSITFRTNKKTDDFRRFVEAHGEIIMNDPDAFRSSGTLVRTVTVVLDKP